MHGYAAGTGKVVHDGVEVLPVAFFVAFPLEWAEFVVVKVDKVEGLGIESGEFPNGVVGRLAHFVLAAHVDDGLGLFAFLG